MKNGKVVRWGFLGHPAKRRRGGRKPACPYGPNLEVLGV